MKTVFVFLGLIAVVLTYDSLAPHPTKKRDVVLKLNSGKLNIGREEEFYKPHCQEEDASSIQAKYIASRLRTIDDKRQRLLAEHLIETAVYKALLGELSSTSQITDASGYLPPPPPSIRNPPPLATPPPNIPQNVVSYSNQQMGQQEYLSPPNTASVNNSPYLTYSGTGEIPSEERQRLRRIHAECEADPKTFVEEALLRKLRVHKDETQVQIHMFCMGEKAGLIKSDGVLDEEFGKKAIGYVIKGEDNINEVYRKCAVEKRNKEETITYYWLCLILEGTDYYAKI